MWDVKADKELQTPFDVGFYLNYVGCKDTLIAALYYGYNRFYLNYVGCKDYFVNM